LEREKDNLFYGRNREKGADADAEGEILAEAELEAKTIDQALIRMQRLRLKLRSSLKQILR
jgi:hypothetical protein